MKHRIGTTIAIAIWATATVMTAVAAETTPKTKAVDQKTFCWKVTTKNSTMYILGSVHIGTPEMLKLGQPIEEAFATSQYLIVEVDVVKAQKDQAGMMQKLMYTPPDTLQQHISSNLYADLVTYFSRYNTPRDAIQQLKPGAVAMTITMLKLSELGYDPEFGIDKYFLDKARDEKRILELETLEQQLNLINELGEDFLKYTLQENEKTKAEFEKLIQAWQAGKPEVIDAMLQETLKERPELKTFMNRFIYERNKSMANTLEKALRRRGTYFTVVGAAHLVGDEGIIKLLQKKGYTARQL